MAEKTELNVGSKEKVAFDLMVYIADQEYSSDKGGYMEPDPRTYALTLFR